MNSFPSLFRECLAQLLIGGIVFLAVPKGTEEPKARPVPARRDATGAGEDQAMERIAVTTAARKMGEVQRETDPKVVAAVTAASAVPGAASA